MPRTLKYLFLIHAIVAALFGALLLIAPGRFLGWVGWAPIDPILSRILGAALLAIAWSSFRGWQATERAQIAILVEMEAAFTVLAILGLLRHLLFAHYPLIVWALFAVFVIFAIAWITSLLKK